MKYEEIIYKPQRLEMSLAAAGECITRVLSDIDRNKESNVEIARKILSKLGFKYVG